MTIGLPSSRDSHGRQMLNAYMAKQESQSLPAGKREYGLKGLEERLHVADKQRGCKASGLNVTPGTTVHTCHPNS